jgi:hypothetical protein
MRQDLARFPQEQPSRLRQIDTSLGALEKRSLQFRLKLADLMTQRGLGNSQLGGGTSKVQRLRDRDEVAKMS